MNRRLRVSVVLFVVLNLVFALCPPTGISGVVKVIPAPDFPYGLAFDGRYLWVGTSYANSGGDFIWKVDPADGAVVGQIPVPNNYQFFKVKGLAFDGQNLWVFEDVSGTDQFYKVDPATGTVLKNFPSPVDNYVGGMAYADGYIWFSQYYSANPPRDILIKMDTTGVPVDTIVTVGEQPMGVAFDGQFVWCAEDTGFGATRQEIYQYDPVSLSYTGNFIRNPDTSPRDMAWDGQYLWLVGYHATNSVIYQISVSGGTPDIDLPVSSLDFGRVSVGDSATLALDILNVGDDTLAIDSAWIPSARFHSNLVGFPLIIPPGGGYPAQVTFSPDTAGIFQSGLVIASNDPDEPQVTVNLTGQGQFAQPTIWLSATSHNFGSVWVPGSASATEGTASWVLKVANSGNPALEIVDLILNLPQFSVGNVNSFPVTIEPGDTFDLVLHFQPDDTLLYQDSLAIASTDPDNPFVFVHLQGRGFLGDYSTGYVFWNFQVPANPRAGSYQEYEVDGLKPINDINGDGVSEVIAATENYWILCLDGNGSGTTDTLWSFNTFISNFSAGSIGQTNDYGVQKALQIASDLNGDGYNDVVIATGGGNEHVYALDGTSGAILWEYGTNDPNSYGLGDFEAVDVRRDFNGDDVPDVLAIADGNSTGTGYQSAYLFDGASGALLWQFPYPGPNPSFGKSIISVDDVTGDGVPDAIINVGNNGTSGLKTYCLDGATGYAVWDRDALGYEPKEIVELPVAGETPDIIVSEYFSAVRRLDGETGVPMWTFQFGGFTGIIQISRIRDVDGDGVDDVVLATFTNALTCLSGKTGTPVWFLPMDYQYDVATVPDLNGDGIDEVLAGSGTNNPTNGQFACVSGTGDSLLFSRLFTGDRVNTVSALPSIDGNQSGELLAGTKGGEVLCFSGGLNAVNRIGESAVPLLGDFELGRNYPNPFNPATVIPFRLPAAATVSLKIFNVLGQEVARPLNKRLFSGGFHQVKFQGNALPSGVYLYRLECEFGTRSGKMILMK